MSETFVEFGTSGCKSGVFEEVDALTINDRGLFGDHETMFVEAAVHINTTYKKGHIAPPGHFVSQREDPVMSQVRVTAGEYGYTLSMRDGSDKLFVERQADAEVNLQPVSVWDWQGRAINLGQAAAEWGSDILGRPVSMVSLSDANPRWVEDNPELGRVGFTDSYPITVVSTRSLQLVNQQLADAGHPPIGFNRPRATIVMDGLTLPESADPETAFPEDYIDEIHCTSGGLTVVLRAIKAVGRCPVPNTIPETGVRAGAPVTKALGALGRAGYHANHAQYGADRELFWSQSFVVCLPQDMAPGQVATISTNSDPKVIYAPTPKWSARKDT